MGKTSQNLRAKWSTQDLRQAIEAVENGRSIAEAARSFNIPRRTLGDWMKKKNDKNPVRKLGRTPAFDDDVESQLKERVVRLQRVGFGVTKKTSV